MPFDPTLPLASSQIASAELRDQFNGLNDLITDLTQRLSDQEAAMATVMARFPDLVTQGDIEPITADNIDAVSELSLTISDPPTASEVEQILNKLNEAVGELHR